ncbi:Recombination enhancement, RecA-dependent nuclease [Chitinasiproducens palmae]|uniref:Recombination enhancement, RecA-dependent nuclease n=2 Tax=Chitinasiproducens palmae TaxID=1770053 RepID=A0A1H2PS71_9BURK|nr:Recombination enhancement, RecA-dependent nuclease [Chitinasiproducens palmae]
MDAVARLGCIVCRNLGFLDSPAELHHPRFLAGGAQRSSHMDVIPLCPTHHRLGGLGVALHAGRQSFEAAYGSEAELLAQVRALLA